MPTFVVVGLGNPGSEYKKNRHNVGFMAVDELVHRHNFALWKSRFNGLVSEGTFKGDKIIALKPLTFMNNSGQSVQALLSFYKISIDDLIVIHDDLDLPVGRIKAKKGGGAGGHNGLKSIDAHCGQNYTRIRIGIDSPIDKKVVSNYVLSDFSKEQKSVIDQEIQDIIGFLDVLLIKDTGAFTTQLALRR